MEKLTLELDEMDFPQVLATYGAEQAKEMAIAMCLKQNQPLTETNLYSNLANLESDLESEALSMDETEQEAKE